jgi:CTP:molybdopterin cytidylyltransferase MocA
MPSVPAILLAAGASRRMGTPKALLPWRGLPLVRYISRVLQEGGASEIIVVISPNDTGDAVAAVVGEELRCRRVRNPDPSRGMLSSVQTGLAAIEEGLPFLVCPCDLPGLTRDAVAAVLSFEDFKPDTIVVPTHTGKRGHPTLFGAKYAAEIYSLDPTAFGLNEILKRHADRVHEIPVPDGGILHDADTPEEWRALTGNSPH